MQASKGMSLPEVLLSPDTCWAQGPAWHAKLQAIVVACTYTCGRDKQLSSWTCFTLKFKRR